MSAGVIASHFVAGGGPSVTVVEQKLGQNALSIAIATTPLPGDRVRWAILSARSTPRTVTSIAGLGGTWNQIHNGGDNRVMVYESTDANAAGNITITLSGSQTFTTAAWVIRGLANSAISASYTTGTGTTLAGPSNNVDAGQVATVLGIVAANPITFPVSPSPASGWTSLVDSFSAASYAIPASTATHQLSETQAAAGSTCYLAQIING